MHVVSFLGFVTVFALAAAVIGSMVVSHGDRMLAALAGRQVIAEAEPQIRVVRHLQKRELTLVPLTSLRTGLPASPNVERARFSVESVTEPLPLAA